MTPDEREYLNDELIKSPKIRKIYDDYIVKEIPYETWVMNMADRLLEDRYEIQERIQ